MEPGYCRATVSDGEEIRADHRITWNALGRPTDEPRAPGVRVLYVSPLKALVYNIERNLRAPQVGIA